MTPDKFITVYGGDLEEILERFVAVEGARVAEVIKNGNHYAMKQELPNIEILTKAKMIKGIKIGEDE